jgi:hypothetical protein
MKNKRNRRKQDVNWEATVDERKGAVYGGGPMAVVLTIAALVIAII